MKARKLGLCAAVALAGAGFAWSWVRNSGPAWADGTVTLRLELGSSPTYSDGSNPNTTAVAALEFWNPYMKRVQLAGVVDSRKPGSKNGTNDVAFASAVYGENFDDRTLAVTVQWFSSSTRVETDVIVNSKMTWNSYRRTLQYPTADLRRVLGHEFGHVLGLGHPDQQAQWVYALMNSTASDIDFTTQDDQDGVAALYGHGVANPATPPTIETYSPYDVTVTEGEPAYFNVYASGTQPFTYQWYRNDVAIVGATQLSLSILVTTLNDAGEYSASVSNDAGSATSRRAKLTVNKAVPPTIYTQPSDQTAVVGMPAGFGVGVSATGVISFRWYKNGQPTSQTLQTYSISNVAANDAGNYHVVVSNAAGSVTSNTASLTVAPLPAPPVVRLNSVAIDEGNPFFLYLSLYPSYGTYQYQWYKDGAPLPGSSLLLSFPTARRTDAGDYFVMVSNAAGSTASTTARITVRPTSTTAVGGWKQVQREGDIVYFLFENPARIERFDLGTNAFLNPITLNRSPSALWVTSDSLFISFGPQLHRLALNGSSDTPLAEFSTEIRAIAAKGGLLYLVRPADSYGSYTALSSFDIAERKTVATITLYFATAGMSIDRESNTMFIPGGVSYSGVTAIQLQGDGSFGQPISSSSGYYGASTRRVWAFPDHKRVLGDTGILYSTTDGSIVSGTGGLLDDADFTADEGFVVLRPSGLIKFDAVGVESGSAALTTPAQAVVVYNDTAVMFRQPAGSGASITWQRLQLSAVNAAEPLASINAAGLAFSPSWVEMDRDGVVMLYSKLHGNIMRWSATERQFLPSIGLHGRPNFLSYAAELHRVYLAYPDGNLRAIDLGHSTAEQPFHTLARDATALAAITDNVLVGTPGSSWPTELTVFAHTGELLSQGSGTYSSNTSAWNASKRRLYHFRDGISPNDLIYTEIAADGKIGSVRDSPYHGEITITPPIKLSPSGDSVLLGSGVFFNADTLQQNNALPVGLEDAAWLGGRLFTARTTLTGVEIQRWGASNYGLDAAVTVPGRTPRLFAVGTDQLLAVTMQDGKPLFTVLDLSLTVHGPPSGRMFFGKFDAAHGGSFAVFVRPNGTAVFLGSAGTTNPAIVVADFTVKPDATFSFNAGAGFGQIDGRIVNDSIQGSTSSPSIDFAGSEDAPAGSTAPFAGYYDGSIVSTADGTVLILAGSDGHAFVLLTRADKIVGTSGTISSSGVVNATFGNGDSLQLTVNSSNRQFSGTAQLSGHALQVAGARDDTPTTHDLSAVSMRAQALRGDNTMIAGVVVTGTGSKRVLLRGIGPGISNVAGFLGNPTMRLFRLRSDGTAWDDFGQNDNWYAAANALDIDNAAARIGLGRLPWGSADAAALLDLSAGVYTVHITGVGDTVGVALVELYDADENPTSTAELAGISMRGMVGTGNDIMIPGFIVSGDLPKQVLVRGIGPDLANVTGRLADPTLRLFKFESNGSSTELAFNDNWEDGADRDAVRAATATVGLGQLAAGSKSAAIVIWLAPGVYTAHVSGANNTSGVALVEMYGVP